MHAITYPLDAGSFLRRRNALRRELLQQGAANEVRVAVLGGTSTQEIVSDLELFLLDRGIRPVFYESGYNRFHEEATVDSAALLAFRPDVAYLCTSSKNLRFWPPALAEDGTVDGCIESELSSFRQVWESLRERLPAATVIQNNFEPPPERLFGNLEASAPYAASRYVAALNAALAREARANPSLKLADVHGLAARMGTASWFSPEHWFSYKMAQSPEAAVYLANSVAATIAALYGRSRKCLVLDLDNTLWGGVIGDDGVQRIQLGRETPVGEAYREFQSYCKRLRERGILLAVCSKNDDAAAREGFEHPDSVLAAPDFSAFRANWDPKHENIQAIASDLNLGLDALVFVDDNPAERALVRSQLPAVAVPEIGSEVSRYASILDEAAYFETAALSREDIGRGGLYAVDSGRKRAACAFADYGEYLQSLDMECEIAPFAPVYLDRIAQLTNKTNQFNLTSKRYTRGELEAFAARPDCVTLYGRLRDRFGDNGLVSVVLGFLSNGGLDIDLWLMSCRVLKRDFELAMFDRLVQTARSRNAARLLGRYVRTSRNLMVADHYENLGFDCVRKAPDGSESLWQLPVGGDYPPRRNRYIREINNGSA